MSSLIILHLKLKIHLIFFLFLVTHLTQLLDVCLSQSYFNHQQKQLLASWKLKVQSLWEHLLATTGMSRQSLILIDG